MFCSLSNVILHHTVLFVVFRSFRLFSVLAPCVSSIDHLASTVMSLCLVTRQSCTVGMISARDIRLAQDTLVWSVFIGFPLRRFSPFRATNVPSFFIHFVPLTGTKKCCIRYVRVSVVWRVFCVTHHTETITQHSYETLLLVRAKGYTNLLASNVNRLSTLVAHMRLGCKASLRWRKARETAVFRWQSGILCLCFGFCDTWWGFLACLIRMIKSSRISIQRVCVYVLCCCRKCWLCTVRK